MKPFFSRGVTWVLGMTLCVYMLAGCGSAGDEQAGTTQVSDTLETSGEEPLYMTADNASDPTSPRVPVLEGREPYDLMAQPWQEAQKAVPAASWWNLTAYKENLLLDPPEMTSTAKYRTTAGKDYYVLACYDSYTQEEENWDVLYYLNRIDGDTLETECHQLYLEELGLTNPHGVISVDVAEDRPVVFVWERDEPSGQYTAYYGVWFDQEGHVESSLDLMPALQEAKLVREDGYLWRDTARWDSRGYYCVRGADNSDRYAVIDEGGALVLVFDPLQGLEEANVCLYHDSQGRCIWEAVSYKNLCKVFWCVDEGQQKKLFEGSYQNVSGRVVNACGDLYYVDSRNALVRWDASTGSCENLYLGGGASFGEYRTFLQNSSGDIVLFYDDGIHDYLFQIANEDVEQVELTLACYSAAVDYYTYMYVGEFNRLHPGIQINLQWSDSWEGRDSNWARIQADLVAGHGPDLLMAPSQQLRILQEKGLLAELSQVLDQDTQEQLFSGVLESGTIDGGLYSVSHTTTATTLIVSRQLWAEDTWTWEDVVALLEEREQAGQPVQSIINDFQSNVLTGGYLLCCFFLSDLEHCSLLDLEEGKAYFDTEEFCHLLEVCKRYAKTENSMGGSINLNTEMAAARRRLKEGEILCYGSLDSAGNFRWFSEDLADLGEDYHLVGYPTEADTGNSLRCYDGIALNAAAEHAELAEEFLNYIVSRTCQDKTYYPVRRDTFTERVSEYTDYIRDGKPRVFLRIPQGATEIYAKPDGASYLPEYLAFMDSCRVSTGVTDPITDIIMEEADAFFAGDKDAKTVAGIIQSRVQLYLNENR